MLADPMIVYGKHHERGREFGELYVQTDSPYYQPGATVSGFVFLNLLKPYPGEDIKLKIKGLEKTCIIGHKEEEFYDPVRGVNIRSQKEHVTSDAAVCFNQSTKIFDFGPRELLEPGQYTFPFSFRLPLHIPGTFHHVEHNLRASITYTAEAFLSSKGELAPKISYKHRFIVVEGSQTEEESIKESTLTVIKLCGCCIPYGSVELCAYFDKNAFKPGDSIKAFVKVDNSSSTAQISSVSVTLKQYIIIKSQEKTILRSSVIYDYSDSKKIQSKQAPTLLEFTIDLPKNPATVDAFSKDLEFLKNAPLFKGQFISSTTHGKLITSRFELHVRATPGALCANKAEVSVACHVMYPDYSLPPFERPEEWTPKELPSVIIPLNLDPTYPIHTEYAKEHLDEESLTQAKQSCADNLAPNSLDATGARLSYGALQEGNSMEAL